MGFNLHRLELIKAKFLASDPNDLQFLFKFIEKQLSDQTLEYSGPLDIQKLRKIKERIDEINLRDLDVILDFGIEQIPLRRTSDKAALILKHLDRIQFYSRELEYSKIEKYIFTLTSI